MNYFSCSVALEITNSPITNLEIMLVLQTKKKFFPKTEAVGKAIRYIETKFPLNKALGQKALLRSVENPIQINKEDYDNYDSIQL